MPSSRARSASSALVADDDEVSGKVGLRQRQAQVRTDAGGFSGGDSD